MHINTTVQMHLCTLHCDKCVERHTKLKSLTSSITFIHTCMERKHMHTCGIYTVYLIKLKPTDLCLKLKVFLFNVKYKLHETVQ